MDNILINQKQWKILDPNSMQTQHSAPVLCCKHYMSMYLDEYRTKLWLSAKKKCSKKCP